MSQKINKNVAPYFDDFDPKNNYHQVLFKPGVPIQARELNNSQSIQQDQLKTFADTAYKNGNLVSGGEITYDREVDVVQLQLLFNNTTVDIVAKQLIGKTIKSNTTNILATVLYYIGAKDSEKNTPTLYIKYTSSGNIVQGIQYTKFADNEVLTIEDKPFAKTITSDATQYTNSILNINAGKFYYDGYFVQLNPTTVLLNQYDSDASVKVGITFKSEFITAIDDKNLVDNAGGFSNCAAIGADRLKISTIISKIPYGNDVPSNFVELIKIKDGLVEYKIDESVSSQIIDAIAQRTYEQAGNYTIEDFKIDCHPTLNDLFNNGTYNVGSESNGIYIKNTEPLAYETTSINGNDYFSVELSPGKAIVRGYEYNYPSKQILNTPKAKSKSNKNNQQLFVDCGSYFELKNISGILDLSASFQNIQFYNKVYTDSTKELIGTAKAVSISNSIDNAVLYIVDFSTQTNITVSGTNANLNYGDYVEGSISGATGYVYSYNGNVLTLENNTGTFIKNETIINSRNTVVLTINNIRDYLIDNIKSVSSTSGFSANVNLDAVLVKGNNFNVSSNTITSTNVNFKSEFTVGSTIKIGDFIGTITSIPNNYTIVTNYTFINQALNQLYKLIAILKSNNKKLYVNLPEVAIANTSNKKLSVTKQVSVTFANGIANIPNQNSNEIASGVVLVQTAITNYLAEFVGVNSIQLQNSNTYSGTAIISFASELSNPTTTTNTLTKNKFIRYNKGKNDVSYSPFGTRYDDTELSLGLSNVTNISAIRYSNTDKTSINYNTNCFDSITLANANNFIASDILYTDTVKARVIQTDNNILYLIYYTNNHFQVGDVVKNWTRSTSNTILNVTPGSYIDLLDNYKLISGDSNTIFDISRLKIIDRNRVPQSDIIVVFDYYNTSIGDVTTVDSYNNGISNVIDFRLYANSSNINGVGSILSPLILTDGALNPSFRNLKYKSYPSPNSIFICDYSYYLSRIDLAVINSDGVYQIISGVDASLPSVPNTPKDCLNIASIYLPAYTDIKDIKINAYSNKRYTMKDISNLDDRIDNIENTIALSLLETRANNTVLLDNNGTVRLKTGFVVDEFSNINLSDTKNRLYQSSVDVIEQRLLPQNTYNNVELEFNQDPTREYTYTKNKSLISLPYTERKVISQNKHNNVVSVNESALTNWEGILNVSPSGDNWFCSEDSPIHDKWLPLSTIEYDPSKLKRLATTDNYLRQQNIQLDIKGIKPNTKINIELNKINLSNLVVPDVLSVIKDGTKGTNNISFIVGESLQWQNTNSRSIDGSKYQPNVISRYTQAKVSRLLISDDIIGVYGTNTPQLFVNWGFGDEFESEDIQTGTYIFGVTSGAIAIIKNTNLISDFNGTFLGNLFIPNPKTSSYKFPTGQLVLKAIGYNTFAENKFICGGSTITDNKTITSLRLPENNDSYVNPSQVNGNNITKLAGWSNPLSQTFIINELGGCFVTSLDLYFYKKDKYIPVIIQIRTVENGYPTEVIVPFSELSINPSMISASANGFDATTIKFPDIVYLKENIQYCICILSNSNQYKLFTGVIGAKDGDKLTITKNPNIGLLYHSQNLKNWYADNTQTLKFSLYKAVFSSVGNVSFVNSIIPPKTLDNAITTTKNSNFISIYCPNHGLHITNNNIKIVNVQSDIKPTILTNIISDAQYTANTTISVETPELIPQLINSLPISNTNPGYLKIDNEIISYIAVNNATKLVTIPIGGRGKNNTPIVQHLPNTVIEVYSLFGIPLIEINKKFTNVVPIDLDNFGVYTINNANISNVGGGKNIQVDVNIQYEKISPNISYKYFPNTSITTTLNGITATSISSNTSIEPPFLPLQATINLNNKNYFTKPLMIACGSNEQVLNRSSLNLDILLSTSNQNISPIIDYDKCSVVVSSNRINNNISNELLPNTTNSAFVYVSKPISLVLPSQAIVVIFDGIRKANHTIEVYLKVSREDNLPEFDKNNFIKVPVVLYPTTDRFGEFRYELRDIPQYKQFQVKIVCRSNTQANHPEIKNLRIISTAT